MSVVGLITSLCVLAGPADSDPGADADRQGGAMEVGSEPLELPPPQPGPQPEPSEPEVGSEDVDIDPDAIELSEGEEPIVAGPEPEDAGGARDRRPPKGQPCDDPSADVPRALSVMEGLRACESARHDARGGKVRIYPGLQLRNQFTNLSPFTLDSEGSKLASDPQVTGRLRLSPRVEWPRGAFVATIDVANGRWGPLQSGDPVTDDILAHGRPPYVPDASGEPYPPVTHNLHVIDPRQAYVELVFPRVGLLRIGQQGFSWGLGLLANDGDNMDRFGDMKFGSDGRGGLYERVLFATRPFTPLGERGEDIVVAVGGDLVYRDENADLTQGDLAGQAILVVRHQPEDRPGKWIGGYAAFRHQQSADDGDVWEDDNLLQVGAFDVAGQSYWTLPSGLTLLGAFEGAVITGRTRLLVEDDEDDLLVLQGGVALRGYIGRPKKWLVGFDGGYSSGDDDPSDRLFTTFRARPGYTAGLLLFSYVQGWQSAQTQQLAQDDDLAAQDPQGSQYIATKGAVSNAIHLQPKARWAFHERLELWGGPLVAFTASQSADPFASRVVGGGANTNALGGPGDAPYLGTEVDLGLRARYEIHGLWLQGGLQGGVLFPGAALSDANGDNDGVIWGVQLRTEIRY